MSRIVVKQFGGLSPSTDPRNLPEDGAQIARNLDMRFGDFRPAKGLGGSVATVPGGTMSIFRTPSGTWLSSTTDTDYVNAPVADAERVYLTGRSAYPEAWQGGEYRRLGVPAPTAKPSTSIVTVDEFDPGDAATATEAATAAVLAAIAGADSTQLFGNAVVSLGAPGAFDPLYPKVQLHLKFDAAPFVDSSPQRRAITTEAGVAFLNDNTGPLGAAGAGCGDFNGGSGVGGLTFSQITRLGTEPDQTWTVDMWLTADETLPELIIESWKGANNDFANPNMRKLAFLTAGGAYRTVMSNVNNSFSTALRCKRTDGSPVLTAGVPTHIALQNTGSAVQVFVDGTLVGTTPFKLGLEFSHFGRATNDGSEAFLGKVDELRVTFAQRYTGNFARPTQPYPTLAVPAGYFVAHGTPGYTGLPTDSAEDAAYLVELVASGGGWAAANPANEYLRALPGAQVTFGGSQFWAVRVAGWRATGLTVTSSAIQSAIAAVENPASPPSLLLTGPQAAALAPLLFAPYNPAANPVAALVAEINAAQAALQAQLAVTPGSATEVNNKLALLKTASDALESYFTNINVPLRAVLTANASEIFGSINSAVVTRNVETRAYVITFVTDWGEESAPSPASDLLTLDQNDNVQIGCPTPEPGRFIVGWRLWRSSVTERGTAFQLVDGTGASNAVMQGGAFAYFAVNNLTYLDDARQEELQETLQTLTWVEPPANLKGLVALPNGILAGFFDKTLCFSEPYAGYAWPVEYQQTVKYRIVGLAVYGQTVVVLTEGHPYYFSGADSASMSGQEVESPQACISKRTIAAVEGGVMYASPDGLCLAGPSGVEVLTTMAFSKADWQALNVASAFGAYSDGSYYLFVNEA